MARGSESRGRSWHSYQLGDVVVGNARIGRFVAAIVSVAAVGLMVSAAEAEVSVAGGLADERHCVVTVVDGEQDASDKQSEVCFKTEALADAHVADLSGGSSFAMSGGSNVIGQHYTSTNFTGSSVTVVGTTCGGGVWWPTGFWNNNLESSKHYCGSSPTTFYDSSNCSTGALFIWSGALDLGWMKNKASCVRYG